MRQRYGPLKGVVSVQKALQDSKTNTRELLKGIKEINVLPDDEGSLICLVTGGLVVGVFLACFYKKAK